MQQTTQLNEKPTNDTPNYNKFNHFFQTAREERLSDIKIEATATS